MTILLSRRRRSAWSSEGDNSEIECKDGFQKHHSAQGRSDWSRKNDDSGKEKKRERSLFYTLDASCSNVHDNGVF
jgi:hypothetical protein